jgi:uncharacterized protein (TIGR02569 family)
VVLRPHGDVEEAQWRSGVLAALPHTSEFRTARPVPTRDGEWTFGEWEAWEWLPGVADETRLVDVIRAGAAFHRSIASLPEPAFIAGSTDEWSRADRMAWEDVPLPDDALLRRLSEGFRPVEGTPQVIHGDLLGNVLFAPDEPPSVIDWAPYWRPSAYGAAVAAVDAACWHGWPLDELAGLADLPEVTRAIAASSTGATASEWAQLLLRALVFRIATLHLLGRWDETQRDLHGPVADAILRLGTDV